MPKIVADKTSGRTVPACCRGILPDEPGSGRRELLERRKLLIALHDRPWPGQVAHHAFVHFGGGRAVAERDRAPGDGVPFLGFSVSHGDAETLRTRPSEDLQVS